MLISIHFKTLEDKFKYLTLLDEKILSSCQTYEIEKEGIESSDWGIKINKTLAKIKECQKGNYSSPPHSTTDLTLPLETPSSNGKSLDSSQEPSAQMTNTLNSPEGTPSQAGTEHFSSTICPSQVLVYLMHRMSYHLSKE